MSIHESLNSPPPRVSRKRQGFAEDEPLLAGLPTSAWRAARWLNSAYFLPNMTPAQSAMAEKSATKTVVFFHPDLGIGGAERLVVDAAVGLQKRGHKVVIFTSHCDPKHCFDEARDGT